MKRFKTEYNIRLNDLLGEMGMGKAFSYNQADFSRMSDMKACISFVDQVTYISTNEEGTEAAAVTAVGMELTSVRPSQNIILHANRPFIYLIREQGTGAILLMGAVKKFE